MLLLLLLQPLERHAHVLDGAQQISRLVAASAQDAMAATRGICSGGMCGAQQTTARAVCPAGLAFIIKINDNAPVGHPC